MTPQTPTNQPGPAEILWIDYDEFKPETYRATVVESAGKQTRFASGDSLVDYANAIIYASSLNLPILTLDSVNNFAQDMQLEAKP